MKALLTAIVFVSCLGASAGQKPTLIKASHALLGTGKAIQPARVLVGDGRILAVGKDLQAPAIARVVDLGEAWLTPGLVDALSYAGLPRGPGENEEGSEVTPSFRASSVIDPCQESLRKSLAWGITTLAVHPGVRNVIGGIICALKPGRAGGEGLVFKDDLGLRITLGPDAQIGNRGMRFGAPGLYTRLPNSRMGTIYLVRQTLQDAIEYRERKKAEPDLPRNPDLEVCLRALDGDLPVFWQARGAKDVYAACNIIREFGLDRNVLVDVWEADRVIDELKSLKVPVLLGPFIHPQYHWGGRRDEGRKFSMAVARRLRDAGIPAGLCHGGLVPGGTLMDSLRFAVRAGLPAAEAMAWVTLRPARIIGVAERVGSIEKGKDADLVAWSGDPLAPTSAVTWVMVDGRTDVLAAEAGEAASMKEIKR